MAGLTFAPFVTFLSCSWIFVLCQGTQELKETVKPGENATLQCQSHRGADITVLRWTTTDLKPDEGYIFFFRSDNSINLNESYRGRVELRDPKMKDGDASMILNNVKTNDTGTYQCWIKEGNNARRRKRDAEPELFSTIKLTVTGHTAGHKEGGDKEGGDKEEGDKDGSVGLRVDLPVVLLLAVGGFMF